jgi:hypothetical protein
MLELERIRALLLVPGVEDLMDEAGLVHPAQLESPNVSRPKHVHSNGGYEEELYPPSSDIELAGGELKALREYYLRLELGNKKRVKVILLVVVAKSVPRLVHDGTNDISGI